MDNRGEGGAFHGVRAGLAMALVALATGIAAAPVHGSVDLQLPEGRPPAFSVAVERDGLAQELVLERHSVRSPGFKVRVYRADGSTHEIAPTAPSTYRGHVSGDPGSYVAASLGPDGLTARVVSQAGSDWQIRPDAGGHVVFEPQEGIERPVDCPLGVPTPTERQPFAASVQTFAGQHLAQIAFDVDFHYYLLKGSSVQNSIDAVEAIMNQVDLFYARDLLVTYEITDIIVRTSQFYFPTGGGSLLEQFRAEWNANQGAVVRDMAHLMTNKSGIEYGGLAYVAAVCNSWAYGWSLDSVNIVGHELGHNWGSGHCHDLAPCNNMCGGCFFIAPETKDIKTAYRDSLSCLDDAGAYPTPLPPYAHPERLTLTRDELAALVDAPFDVLGNDHDGNLDPLSIDGHDSASDLGGTVTLSPGTGPDGRDELIYGPPGYVFLGEDRFDYTVADGTGLDQTGDVKIDVPARGLVGYWKLDDGLGTTAADASNRGRHGTTEGSPSWTLGQYSRALAFDGIDDAVALPPMYLRTDVATITAWVKRNGSQTAWAGIVFSREENTLAGLSFGTANELRYHWNGTADTFNWNSGLVVPDQQWVFVAIVVEPQQATMYLHDGTLQSAVNSVSHGMEGFDGGTRLGHDSFNSIRRFRGVMDDTRIYDRALTPDEIEDLAERGGNAVGPNPPDGGRFVPLVGALSWVPGLAADSHDVYLGTDYEAVRDATTASDEFVGNRTVPDLPVGGIVPGQVYAWRVDEVAGADVIKGDVWLFTRAESGGHWKLDEVGGPTAADSDGTRDGTYQGGAQPGEPGATPMTGLSVRLDGVNDYVEIPALDLNREEITITGWVRRSGAQSNFAGIIFSRAGSTTAGISSLVTGDLRYHWNDAYWDWVSGMNLPNDEWVFLAFVVRADMATIYLGIDGDLTSSYNATLHGSEEFDGAMDFGKDGTAGRFFDGWLDDVRVWRSALSPRDIESVYGETLAEAAAGEIEDSLILDRAGNDVQFSWSPSCVDTDVDYAIYEGTIGDFTSHAAAICGTFGATSAAIEPDAGDRYFLVVPLSSNREGSYGVDSDGVPRVPGAGACAAQAVAACR